MLSKSKNERSPVVRCLQKELKKPKRLILIGTKKTVDGFLDGHGSYDIIQYLLK